MLQFNVVETSLSCSITVGSGSVCVFPPVVVPWFPVVVVPCVFPPVVSSAGFPFSAFAGFSSPFKFSVGFCSPLLFVCSSSEPVTGKTFDVPSAALASPSSFKNVTVPTTAIAKTNIAIITVRMVFVFPFIFYPPIFYFTSFAFTINLFAVPLAHVINVTSRLPSSTGNIHVISFGSIISVSNISYFNVIF